MVLCPAGTCRLDDNTHALFANCQDSGVQPSKIKGAVEFIMSTVHKQSKEGASTPTKGKKSKPEMLLRKFLHADGTIYKLAKLEKETVGEDAD